MSVHVGVIEACMRRSISLLAVLVTAACSAAPSDDASSDQAAVTGTSTLTFASDWSVTASKPLVAGMNVKVDYAASRNPCTGMQGGKRVFSTTVSYQLGTTTGSVVVAGLNPSGPLAPSFTVPNVVLGRRSRR